MSTIQYPMTEPSILYPTNVYLTPGDLARRFSVAGLMQHTEDLGPASSAGEVGSLEEICWDATDIVNYYCLSIYTPEDLARSFWVNRRATDIGTYLLACRRGLTAPEGTINIFKQAIAWLESVHDSRYEIPGVPVRITQAPAWSNIRVDQRYSTNRIRVERVISQRAPVSYQQPIDWQSEFDFSI